MGRRGSSRGIALRPVTRAQARAFVHDHHSHHRPTRMAVLRVGAELDGDLVGVCVIETPAAPALDDGRTWDVSRLCVRGDVDGPDGHASSVASRLLGAAWRAARAVGCHRAISYTRQDEDGTCYRAAGWVPVALVRGRRHDTGGRAGRWLPGLESAVETTEVVDRVRWEIGPGAAQTRVRRCTDGRWLATTPDPGASS